MGDKVISISDYQVAGEQKIGVSGVSISDFGFKNADCELRIDTEIICEWMLEARFWILDTSAYDNPPTHCVLYRAISSDFASFFADPPPHCVLCRAGATKNRCATPDKIGGQAILDTGYFHLRLSYGGQAMLDT